MSDTKHRDPRVSIVIPTLEEAGNIDPLLERVLAAVRELPFGVEVIVVDDRSADGTAERVRAWTAEHPVRLLERAPQGGLAGAVLAGAQRAQGEVVVVMDADLSHPPERIPDLVRPLLDGDAEMAVGSRYVEGGSTPDWPWRRRLISRVASWLAWPLVDVHDPMSGFFAVRRERLLDTSSSARGYKIGLEIIVAGGESLAVEEVPIEFSDRLHGRSKLGAGEIWRYLDRLRSLAGGAVSTRTSTRFAVVGALGIVVDVGIFELLLSEGLGLATAHITSFLAATLFNYVLDARWAFRGSGRAAGEAPWRQYLRFLAVALLALSLRGALLGRLVRVDGWDSRLAIVAAVGVAALVNYLGYAFFVFPPPETRHRTAIRWRVAAVGLVAYAVLLRFFYLGLSELLAEEAYYWNYAQHPALSYLDHPPMVAWLIGLGTALAGDTELGVRLGAFLCWGVTALFGYLTARWLFGKSAAFRAVLLIAVLPIFFAYGLFLTPDAPLIACWAGSVYFLSRALLGERARAWWGVGICLGLGMLSKYTIALLGPAVLVFLVVDRRSRRWLARPGPYGAAALVVALFTPVIVWNARNGWASFLFQSVRRLEETPQSGLPVLIESLLLLLTPVGLLAAVAVLVPRFRHRSPAGTAGGAPCLADPGRCRLFAAVFALVPLLVLVVFSLRHVPKLNWAGPLWLSVVPLLAWDMIAPPGSTDSGLRRRLRRWWVPTILITLLLYGFALHYVTLGLPGIPYPPNFKHLGWRELGRRIEVVARDVERVTGRVPLVVGMDKYSLASELAFYRARYRARSGTEPTAAAVRRSVASTTSRHLVAYEALMYERWFPPRREAGRTVILVDDRGNRLAEDGVRVRFDRLSEIEPVVIDLGEGSTRTFFYRIGYGYRPPAAAGP